MSALFESVNSVSAVQHASTQLREAIITGRVQPGSRLIETELADQLGVSRGPIREALRELSREGLVQLRRNRGAVVTSVGAEDVLEVYALRSALGSLALRQLIGGGRVTEQTLKRLERLAQRAKSKEARRRQTALVEADLAFQDAIADVSGLRRVATDFRILSIEIRMFVNVLGVRYTDVDEILSEHDKLVVAIREHDLAQAERVWRARFRRAVTEFLSLIPHGDVKARRRPELLLILDDRLLRS